MYHALIVDDTSAEVQCIQFLVRKYALDLQVQTASNGLEALSLMEKQRFDILLTDIKMPLMDGLELAQNARLLDGGLKIVLFSGYNEFEYAKTAISIGVTDYLMKPIDPEAFCGTMRRVIQSIDQMRLSERESAIVRRHMIRMLLDREDDGAGFPPALDFRNAGTLGLQLVVMLVDQLDGTIAMRRGKKNGTEFSVEFRELSYKPRF